MHLLSKIQVINNVTVTKWMLGCFHTYNYVDEPQTSKLILSSHIPVTSQTLLYSLSAPCIEAEFQYGKTGELPGERETAERQNMCFT